MEGLQVQRYLYHDRAGMVSGKNGEWVKFSDYNTLHESAQNLTAKTLELKAEKIQLVEALKGYMAGHPCSDKKGNQCPTLIAANEALEAAGEEA